MFDLMSHILINFITFSDISLKVTNNVTLHIWFFMLLTVGQAFRLEIEPLLSTP